MAFIMPFVHLWLPTLVSAIAIFFVSSLMHMVLPWHKSDYRKLPNEDAVSDALRALNIPAGEYMAPRPDERGDMRSPEFKAKVARGPRYILNIMPGGSMAIGRELGLWFVYCLVVNAFAGHLAWGAGVKGDDAHMMLHTVGLAAFMGYSFALWQATIWFRRPWRTALKSTVDGLVYGLVTAVVFLWLWPL